MIGDVPPHIVIIFYNVKTKFEFTFRKYRGKPK